MAERIFICITDGVVVNSVVGDDTFADLIRPGYDEVTEVTDATPRPGVGWLVTPDGLRPVKPYPSWVWDVDRYVAPVPKPTEGGPWTWDEDTTSWVEITPEA